MPSSSALNRSSGRVLGVIPARLASQRLPEKPIREIHGKTLLQRVWEQAKQAKTISRLVVATDSEIIAELGRSFDAEVVMTEESITTGSERVARAASLLSEVNWDAVANIQGDMPFIHPELIDSCVSYLLSRDPDGADGFDMATVATEILEHSVFVSENDVKVVVAENGRALYFSRAPIPHSRDGNRLPGDQSGPVFGHKHFGLYVFRPSALGAFSNPGLSRLESVEKLEQLRLLEAGYRIGVLVAPARLTAGSVEVDTAQDLQNAAKIAASREVKT